ncbi:PEP-CTERM sorting domain-containing protein [Luteolibacter sp. AS25]|uniref:PEP-CTERM sorting domain-containing protein n=1 Tax=Luteolibacter sp. AS25 TaxID=3135776 RepID=UPI00398AAE9A
MKAHIIACLAGILPVSLTAQTIYDGTGFFSPSIEVKRSEPVGGLLSLNVDNVSADTISGSSGAVSWEHSVKGHAQVGLNVVIASLDVQLGAKARTTGSSLVFGREITVAGTASGLSGLLNQVAGAGALYDWESNASVTGLAIAPEQVYRVSFDVTSGAGLPVNLLSSSQFGITNASVTGATGGGATLLNLADLVTLGAGSDTGTFTFDFKSSTALSQLDFNFGATSIADVNLLGGTAGNQNVLTYSNLQVTQVPEPSAILLSCIGGLLVFRRRR